MLTLPIYTRKNHYNLAYFFNIWSQKETKANIFELFGAIKRKIHLYQGLFINNMKHRIVTIKLLKWFRSLVMI